MSLQCNLKSKFSNHPDSIQESSATAAQLRSIKQCDVALLHQASRNCTKSENVDEERHEWLSRANHDRSHTAKLCAVCEFLRFTNIEGRIPRLTEFARSSRARNHVRRAFLSIAGDDFSSKLLIDRDPIANSKSFTRADAIHLDDATFKMVRSYGLERLRVLTFTCPPMSQTDDIRISGNASVLMLRIASGLTAVYGLAPSFIARAERSNILHFHILIAINDREPIREDLRQLWLSVAPSDVFRKADGQAYKTNQIQVSIEPLALTNHYRFQYLAKRNQSRLRTVSIDGIDRKLAPDAWFLTSPDLQPTASEVISFRVPVADREHQTEFIESVKSQIAADWKFEQNRHRQSDTGSYCRVDTTYLAMEQIETIRQTSEHHASCKCFSCESSYFVAIEYHQSSGHLLLKRVTISRRVHQKSKKPAPTKPEPPVFSLGKLAEVTDVKRKQKVPRFQDENAEEVISAAVAKAAVLQRLRHMRAERLQSSTDATERHQPTSAASSKIALLGRCEEKIGSETLTRKHKKLPQTLHLTICRRDYEMQRRDAHTINSVRHRRPDRVKCRGAPLADRSFRKTSRQIGGTHVRKYRSQQK